MGSLVAVLIQIFSWFSRWNKFENRSIFDEVKANWSKCASFRPQAHTHSYCYYRSLRHEGILKNLHTQTNIHIQTCMQSKNPKIVKSHEKHVSQRAATKFSSTTSRPTSDLSLWPHHYPRCSSHLSPVGFSKSFRLRNDLYCVEWVSRV